MKMKVNMFNELVKKQLNLFINTHKEGFLSIM